MTAPYIYSQPAENDLRDILRYTTRQWGAAQARAYARRIEDAAADLFGIHRTERPALILAILHERMDLMARLQDRLN